MRAWPWHEVCVDVFNVENEPPAGTPSYLPQLSALLLARGYEHRLRVGVDEVFVRSVRCRADRQWRQRQAQPGQGAGGGRQRGGRQAGWRRLGASGSAVAATGSADAS